MSIPFTEIIGKIPVKEIIGIALILALAYYLFICDRLGEPFASIQFPGYKNSPNFKFKSSFINFNRPDEIDWNLFMLINRFRFQSVVPFYKFSKSPLVFPHNGLPTAPNMTPVLMVPGLGDCCMIQHDSNQMVWPPKGLDSFKGLEDSVVDINFDSSNSNMTPLIDLLKSLKYTSDIVSIQPYDFRRIATPQNLIELFKRIRQDIMRLHSYGNMPVMLVAQDLGCTLLSLFLSRQQEDFVKNYIADVVFVGTALGGTIQGAKDYVGGVDEFGEFNYLPRHFDGLKLKLPNKLVFGDQVVINYNGADYTANQLHELLRFLDIEVEKEIHELQKESLSKPPCDITFINNRLTNEQNSEIYEYWQPSSVHTIDVENSKLFNNYDAMLVILRKLNYSV